MRVDVYEYLDRLGIQNLDHVGDEVWYSCPFPGHAHGDKNRSASMNVDTGSFYCHGCQRSGNMITFLAEFEGVPPHRAKRLIAEAFEKPYEEPQGSMSERMKEILHPTREELPQLPTVSEDYLRTTRLDWDAAYKHHLKTGIKEDPVTSYMFKRGFRPEILAEHEIGQDPVSGALTIPYRDSAGKLAGVKGRRWNLDARVRYFTLGGPKYGFSTFETSSLLYGLWDVITGSGELIVVEGELNRLAMKQYGYGRVVGISGKKLSKRQANQVCDLTDHAVMFFDEVEDGLRAAKVLDSRISVRVVGEHEHDPADSSDEEVAGLLDSAKPSGLLSVL